MALSCPSWAKGITTFGSRRKELAPSSTKQVAIRANPGVHASSSFKIEDTQACPNGAATNGAVLQARQLASQMFEGEGGAQVAQGTQGEAGAAAAPSLATSVVHAGG